MRVPQVLVSRLLQPSALCTTATTTTTTTTAVAAAQRGALAPHRLASLIATGGSSSKTSGRCSFSTTTLMMKASSSSSSSSSSKPTVSGTEMLDSLFPGSQKNKLHGQDIGLAIESLAAADCVCFDVDSTVIDEEGIDVLADYLGKGEQVAALTLAAMEGGMKFQDALAARLDLLQPSQASILACLDQTPLHLTAGVAEFVQALQQANKEVYLVSGGFRIMIEPVADLLGISHDKIYANTILFADDDNGTYQSFDATEPTSADMGKPKALEQIQQAGGYQTMVMIGDGATDAQAKPPAAAFVGFGGVAVREKVQQVADWFVTDFDDLTRVVREYGTTDSKK